MGRGYGLVEALVALALAALVLSMAFELHGATRRSYKEITARAERQQDLRAAFATMRRTLRQAGCGSDANGDSLQSSEQLEAGFDGAIVLRSGGSEIVGYALAKPDGTSAGTLSFDHGSIGTVRIRDIATVQDDPPYTLYRLSIRHHSSAVARVPVMDNVFSLRLSYFDAFGSKIPAPGGADGPSGAGSRVRASIRRIGIDLSAADAVRLSGEITPPNLGLYGLSDLLPPSSP